MAETLGSAVLELRTDLKTLRGDLKASKAEVAEAVKHIQANLRDVGKKLSLGLTAPLAAFGGLTVKTAADFETAMNQVAAVSGATADQFQGLEAQAKELGRTTQFSASQAGEAMGFLAQAGFDANDILGAMPGTLQLASAAQLDLGTAADTVSNILSGYGLEVSELGRVNDVLVKTFTSANTNLQQLGEAMKYAGPVASAAGVGFEEAAAALGLMGNAGIQASMAGTSLRGAISRILTPTKQMEEAMDAAGLSFTDSEGRLKPLDEIVRQLEPHAEDAGLMMQLFGQRAGPAMSALVSQGADALTNLQFELENSAGTAKEIADVQMQGLNGALNALKSAFEGLQIAIAQSGLLEFATKFVHVITGVISAMAEAHPAILGVGTVLAGLAAAAGPVLFVLPTMVTSLGLVKGAFLATAVGAKAATLATNGFKIAMTFLTGPIGIAVAAITTAIGLIVTFRKEIAEFLGFTDKSAKATSDLVGEFKAAQAEQKALADEYARLNASMKEHGDETGEVRERLNELEGELIEVGGKVSEYRAKINEVAEAEGDLAGKLKESSLEYESLGGRINALQEQLQILGGENEEVSAQIEKLKQEQAKAGKEARKYALLLQNSTKRTGKLSTATQKLINKTLGLKSAADDAAEEIESAAEEVEDLGKAAKKTERELFDLEKVTASINREQEEFARNLKAVRDEFNRRFIRAVKDAKPPIVALGPAANTAANEILLSMTQTAIPAFDKVKEHARLVEQETAQAFRNLGIKTRQELTDLAEQADLDFQRIRDSGEATAEDVDRAWAASLQARKKSLIANGQDLNEEEQRILGELLAKQETFKEDSAGPQGVFAEWFDGVSSIVSDLSRELTAKLFTGDLSFGGSFGEKLKTLSDSFRTMFVDRVSEALDNLVQKGFKKLLGVLDSAIDKITGKNGLVSAMSSLGKTAATESASGAGAVAGQVAGGVGPGSAGKFAGGAGAVIDMVAGIATAVSSIISNFQQRRMNDRLYAIMLNTRYLNDRLDITNLHYLQGIWQELVNAALPIRGVVIINLLKELSTRLAEITTQLTDGLGAQLQEGLDLYREGLALAAASGDSLVALHASSVGIENRLDQVIDRQQEQTGVLRSILRKVNQPPVVKVSVRGGSSDTDRINRAIELNTGGLRSRIAEATG